MTSLPLSRAFLPATLVSAAQSDMHSLRPAAQ